MRNEGTVEPGELLSVSEPSPTQPLLCLSPRFCHNDGGHGGLTKPRVSSCFFSVLRQSLFSAFLEFRIFHVPHSELQCFPLPGLAISNNRPAAGSWKGVALSQGIHTLSIPFAGWGFRAFCPFLLLHSFFSLLGGFDIGESEMME